MAHVDEDEAHINVQTSYPMPARVPSIRSSLTVDELVRFQGIEVENETMNYGFIVGNEEDDITLIILLINQMNNNMLNNINIGGMIGSKAAAFEELHISKCYTRESPSDAMHVALTIDPDAMSSNKHKVDPKMMNIITFRFKKNKSNMIDSATTL